jgi:hypothetical protein
LSRFYRFGFALVEQRFTWDTIAVIGLSIWAI